MQRRNQTADAIFSDVLDEALTRAEIVAQANRENVEISRLRQVARREQQSITEAVAREERALNELRAARAQAREQTKSEVPELTVPLLERALVIIVILLTATSVVSVALAVNSQFFGLLGATIHPTWLLWIASIVSIGTTVAAWWFWDDRSLRGSIDRRERHEKLVEQRLAQLEQTLDMRSLHAEEDATRANLRQSLLERTVAFLSHYLTDQSSHAYDFDLNVQRAPGLSELFDRDYEISTRASNRLAWLLGSMPSGSIGISGPRGAGKTTLIRSFCEGARLPSGALAVYTSAPVEYAPREFILHLFGLLSRRVLGSKAYEGQPMDWEVNAREEPFGGSFESLVSLAMLVLVLFGSAVVLWFVIRELLLLESHRAAVRIGLGVGLMALGAGLVMLGMWTYRSTHSQSVAWLGSGLAFSFGTILVSVGVGLFLSGLWQGSDPVAILVCLGLGVVLAAIAFAYFVTSLRSRRIALTREREMSRREMRNGYSYSDLSGLESTAKRLLEKIQFQLTFSSGWSGSLKLGVPQLPIEAETGVTAGRTLTQQQMTLPDIVEAFRSFAEEVSSTGTVLIGIDEMDKMGSDELARAFLNDIKSIFNLKQCYYLIAVSEDAMASFERRGMPFRDVFDSSFDDIVKVPYLDMEGCKSLLYQRITGISIPFVALCYCASGGLARDLIRAARNLLDISSRTAARALAPLAEELVRREFAGKQEAILSAVKGIPLQPEADETLLWCSRLGPDALSASGLLKQISQPAVLGRARRHQRETGGDVQTQQQTLERLIMEFATFSYYCATMLEFFGPTLDERTLRSAESDAGVRSIDQLARGRQAFSLNPQTAWDTLTAFRISWDLEAMPILRLDSLGKSEGAPASATDLTEPEHRDR